MTFEFKPERYDDGSGSDHWFSGIYKITKYEEIVGRNKRVTVPLHYQAYFKPVNWDNWGNSVDYKAYSDGGYDTLEDAQAACERHAQRFTHPFENDRF